MLPNWILLLAIVAYAHLAAGHEDEKYGVNEQLLDTDVFRAVVESCGG